MSRTRYLLPLLSATALTSVSFNLLVFKRDAKVERERLEAQTSILESLVSRLKKGEKIGEEEVERLVGLARRGGVEGDEEGGRSRIMKGEERVGWREAFMGRKGLNKSDGGSGSEEDGFDLSKCESVYPKISICSYESTFSQCLEIQTQQLRNLSTPAFQKMHPFSSRLLR
jgi:hypothetical protein